MLLLFTSLCEEIPGCALSGHRSYGAWLSPKDARVAGTGGFMAGRHDWYPHRPAADVRRGFPGRAVSMGSPRHREDMVLPHPTVQELPHLVAPEGVMSRPAESTTRAIPIMVFPKSILAFIL